MLALKSNVAQIYPWWSLIWIALMESNMLTMYGCHMWYCKWQNRLSGWLLLEVMSVSQKQRTADKSQSVRCTPRNFIELQLLWNIWLNIDLNERLGSYNIQLLLIGLPTLSMEHHLTLWAVNSLQSISNYIYVMERQSLYLRFVADTLSGRTWAFIKGPLLK